MKKITLIAALVFAFGMVNAQEASTTKSDKSTSKSKTSCCAAAAKACCGPSAAKACAGKSTATAAVEENKKGKAKKSSATKED